MQNIKFYHWDKDTLEYIEETEPEYDPIGHELMIPACCTLEKPLAKRKNKSVIRLNDAWEYIEDYRSSVAYVKTTKEEVVIQTLGSLHEDLTLKKPKDFSKWDESSNSWLIDETLLEQHNLSIRKNLLDDTDWYVIRQVETGIPIPLKIRKYRQALRDITNHRNWPNIKFPKRKLS